MVRSGGERPGAGKADRPGGAGRRPGAGATRRPGGEGRGMLAAGRRASPEGAAVRRLVRQAAAVRKTLGLLAARLEKLALTLEKAQLTEYVELARKPRRLIWSSFLSGVARGVGIALGFTIFAATIVWFLQRLGALNLPIVGDYIAEIVRIVQRQLELKTY